jgi:hypothetical protein
MNKRAQLIGQVFIFIIAGIVFVLILAYGYKAIMSFLQTGEQVQLTDFRNQFESSITTIKRDYGSVQRIDLRVPTKTEEICFVTANADDLRSTAWQESFKQNRTLMYNAWLTSGYNIFLVPTQTTSITIPDILIDPEGYLCMPVAGGMISLRVEGMGNKAKISAWPAENK